MARDRARFVNPGIPVALTTTLRLMTRVLNDYARGRRFFAPIIDEELRKLAHTLADGMSTGYLYGARRSLIHSAVKFQAVSEYDEAMRFLQHRLRLDPSHIDQVQDFYQAPAFRVMDKVSRNIDSALQRTMLRINAEGLHIRDAKVRLAQVFDKLNLTPKHRGTLEAIFRTQTQMAYSAGQWAYNAQPDIQEILWGYKYSAVGDERTREEHALLDGTTLPKDDPRWNSIFPPNGWNCRCVPIEIYRTVPMVEPPGPTQIDGRTVIPGPDKGFDFNPGKLLDPIGEQLVIRRAIALS